MPDRAIDEVKDAAVRMIVLIWSSAELFEKVNDVRPDPRLIGAANAMRECAQRLIEVFGVSEEEIAHAYQEEKHDGEY